MTIMPWTGPGPNPERPWESQPFGLVRPNVPRGLFGASSRIRPPMRLGSGPRFADGSDAPIAEPGAPPITVVISRRSIRIAARKSAPLIGRVKLSACWKSQPTFYPPRTPPT